MFNENWRPSVHHPWISSQLSYWWICCVVHNTLTSTLTSFGQYAPFVRHLHFYLNVTLRLPVTILFLLIRYKYHFICGFRSVAFLKCLNTFRWSCSCSNKRVLMVYSGSFEKLVSKARGGSLMQNSFTLGGRTYFVTPWSSISIAMLHHAI